MKKILHHLKAEWYKYLLEILVITTGILVAFFLNSWKEQRSLDQENRKILGFILNDLRSDVAEIDSVLVEYQEDLTRLRKIAQDSVDFADYINDPLYLSSITGFEDIAINKRGLSLLETSTNIQNDKSIEIANLIVNTYSDRTNEIDIAMGELIRSFNDMFDFISTKQWFFDLFLTRSNYEGFAAEMRDNPQFRLKVSKYYLFFGIYTTELANFRDDAKKLIVEIETYLAN